MYNVLACSLEKCLFLMNGKDNLTVGRISWRMRAFGLTSALLRRGYPYSPHVRVDLERCNDNGRSRGSDDPTSTRSLRRHAKTAAGKPFYHRILYNAALNISPAFYRFYGMIKHPTPYHAASYHEQRARISFASCSGASLSNTILSNSAPLRLRMTT